MRLVPEGAARATAAVPSHELAAPSRRPAYPTSNPVGVFRKLNFASQEWELTQ
jgi:hypothetical protein